MGFTYSNKFWAAWPPTWAYEFHRGFLTCATQIVRDINPTLFLERYYTSIFYPSLL
jgi:hypothetical protein